MADDLVIDGSRVVPKSALEVKTARASGPGGQHVNRTETKVQLRFDPGRVDWIDEHIAARLRRLAGQSVDAEGCILIVSQEQRDQLQNLARTREKLAQLLRAALVKPKRRIATKPTRGSRERRLKAKRHRADTKARRRATGDE